MPQDEEVKMSLRTVWDLELLHHLILRLKEAEYDLGSVVGILYLLLRKLFIEEKDF